MELKDTIQSDMIAAMKARDTLRMNALKMIKAEILKLQTSAANVTITNDDVLQILLRAIKQRNEAAEGFRKGGNLEAAENERKEAEIYKSYLPEQLSEEELKGMIREAVKQSGASGPGDFGKIMGALMPKVKGKADGALVNKLVKEALGA